MVSYIFYLQVEVKAVPIDKKELGECDPGRKMRRLSQPDPLTFGGHPAPMLHHSYEPTIRDKMCFHSITIMKVNVINCEQWLGINAVNVLLGVSKLLL